MRILKYILLFLFIPTGMIYAQSDLLFSNYNINSIARNPAAIENNGFINAYLGAHQQWIGFDDAPNMQWVQVSNFFEGLNMGLSLNIMNQSVGAAVTQNIKLGYNYQLYFKGGHRLSLGLGAGVYFRRLDFSKLVFEEEDQSIPVTDERKTLPDFDFGAEYYYQNLTVGFASNHITIFNSNATLFKIPLQNHIYIDYQIKLSPEFIMTPRFDFFNSNSITSIGGSLDLNYDDKINAGIAYRHLTSLILRAGVKLGRSFYLNYAYDMGAGSFSSYNSGVHEIIIIGRFGKKNQSYNSPRFID